MRRKDIIRLGGLFVVCFLCLVFWSTLDGEQRLVYDEILEYFPGNTSEYCDGELFSYQHISIVDSKRILQKGKPFDCSKLEYLRKLHLTKEYEIDDIIPSNYPDDLVFVSGTSFEFFDPLKAAFETVRKQFGSKNKFILYDLGGLKTNHEHEISEMCNVELRTFDFNQMPQEVRRLQIFAWKVFIIAEVLNRENNVIYLDSSIFFQSNDYGVYFEMMSKDFQLPPFLMSGYTGHSVQFATNPKMYGYLPMDLNVARREIRMLEANLLLLHRNEFTRQLLKWAVLCASTLGCIDPPGSTIFCNINRKNESGVCNRQDQSLFSILSYNLEYTFKQYGFPTLSSDDASHPSNVKSRHICRRGQTPAGYNLNCSKPQ